MDTTGDITLELITENFGVYISKEHRFGTDAVLLSDFCAPKSSDIAIDIGTGTGIIPLRWYALGKAPKFCAGVELSPAAAELAKRSSNEFTNGEFKVFCENIKTFSLPKEINCATLVSCNPPYFKKGSGEQRKGDELVARCEEECSIYDVCSAAYRLLKYGGRLCVCHRPDRLCDVFEAMRKNRIEPKKLQIVSAGKEGRPFLIMVEGRKDGNQGLTVLPEIRI